VSARVLAIDLGTSRVKVALVDETLTWRASASWGYPTRRDPSGRAEQDPTDWLDGVRRCAAAVLADAGEGPSVDAVVLTAQMPTLVALDDEGGVLDAAVTWQDARADALVEARLDPSARRRVTQVSGAPIDGRYVIPMDLYRAGAGGKPSTALLSAKDYLYFRLTGQRATDPSTASGYGNYDLAARGWSVELSALWGVDPERLPEIVAPSHAGALSSGGAELLGGPATGTPVVVGAADSVCAHHYVNAFFPGAVSVIDGSSTVVIATLSGAAPPGVLVTPLIEPTERGGEMDLLATGSSLEWLAAMLEVSSDQLEQMALDHPHPETNEVRFSPYLARGEQGALWRNDLTGSITGITLATTRADVALALFEGIAIETQRCLDLLATVGPLEGIVSLAGPTSRHLGAAMVAALSDAPLVALAQQSPSILGAALLALDGLGVERDALRAPQPAAPPALGEYGTALRERARAALTAPGSPGRT
jgi:xylulokinase